MAIGSGDFAAPVGERIPAQRLHVPRQWTTRGPGAPRVKAAHKDPTTSTAPAPRRDPDTAASSFDGRSLEKSIMLAGDLLVVVPLVFLLEAVFVAVTVAVTVVALRVRGMYAHRITLSVLDDLPTMASAVVLGVAPVALLAPVVGPGADARTVLLTAAALLVGVVTGRAVSYAAIIRSRVRGRISYPTLLLGSGGATAALARRVADHPESGLHLVGTVADSPARAPHALPLLGSCRDLADVMRQHQVTDVVIGYGGMSSAALVDVLRTCDRADVEIYVVPRLFDLHALRGGDDHIWGLPLIRIRRPAQRGLTWRVKRAFDVAAAGAILFLTLPVALAVAAAVRVELGRGVLFRQTRIGLNGQPFELLKFRSMPTPPPGAEPGWTVPEGSLGRVGAFIRRYSLDEVPQLWNVLKGDMSLVGPRPERPEYVEQFCAVIPRYVHRHRVPVGMTGLAAVNGLRGDTSIEDRAQFDNWYIDSWSLWLDVKILVRTAHSVLRGTGT
ncbi:MAG TPA: sugar transferase [Nocardioidaceae bacterium]